MTAAWQFWQQEAQEEELEEEVDYSQLVKADLVQLAEYRGLDSSGTKADIIARLEEDDGA